MNARLACEFEVDEVDFLFEFLPDEIYDFWYETEFSECYFEIAYDRSHDVILLITLK